MTFWIDTLGASINYHDAAGVSTRVIEAGDGEPVIFLHGIGGHVEAFSKNIVPLSEEYRAIAVDMVGHGMSGKPALDYAVPDYVDHVVALMKTMGIDKAHFVGESLGGLVAFWIALTHPERVISYVSLVGTGLKLGGFDPARNPGMEELRRRSRAAGGAPTFDSIKSRLEWLFHEPEKFVSDELVEARLRMWLRPAEDGIQPPVKGLRDPELHTPYHLTEERLRGFDKPTYFLWTEFNPTVPWQVAEAASNLVEGAWFDVMSNCGHWPQYENPEEFHRKLCAFLRHVSAL